MSAVLYFWFVCNLFSIIKEWPQKEHLNIQNTFKFWFDHKIVYKINLCFLLEAKIYAKPNEYKMHFAIISQDSEKGVCRNTIWKKIVFENMTINGDDHKIQVGW